ncbi:MAG: nitrogen fixation protein NifQ [Desulfosporosinus sp.]|nr:nitrogen fixation protein NifQ [Desulfosporosinus sp.]
MPNFPNQYFAPKPNHVPPNHAAGVRERLMACKGEGDEFDRYVVSCALATAMAEVDYHPLTEALGLARSTIAEILEKMFPGSYSIDELVPQNANTGEDAPAEPVLRDMLIANRTSATPLESWVAHIFIRRCQVGDHMWRSIGLFSRNELTEAMLRYFKPLAVKNIYDLKWKRFIYRQMREENNLDLEKYPYCENCSREIITDDGERFPFCAHCPDFEECSATEDV